MSQFSSKRPKALNKISFRPALLSRKEMQRSPPPLHPISIPERESSPESRREGSHFPPASPPNQINASLVVSPPLENLKRPNQKDFHTPSSFKMA